MSLDLFDETDKVLANLRPVANPEPGVWDNFTAGAGKVAMQTFAKAGRAASMAAAPLAMAFEKAPGLTEVQDKFFKAHDEIFGRAVDYWTPKPGEVGEAGQVVGQLLGTLPMLFASPALTVAQTQLSVAEDMARKGVDAGTAQAIGATQAAGLGLGIWVPILGKTLAQRVLVGGAGFNVVQGGATRAISAKLAEGTAAEGDFKTFDPTALTLDVLLGAAFGGIAHINPRMRAEGEAWQKRLTEWGAKLKPSEVDALAALRQAQHLNADSMPGKPVDVADTNAHVNRMRQAIDDLANDRPVNVDDMPAPRFESDAARAAEAEMAVKAMQDEAKAEGMVLEENVLPKVSLPETVPSMADPIYRQSIEAMANETGWAEQGGRVIRDQDGQVSGRTSWVPNAEWWPGRPKELSEAKAKKAIRKALDGEPLKPAEQRLIDYMLEYSRERVAPALRRLEALDEAERANIANDLMADGMEGHVRDIADADIVGRAAEIDDGALEKAAILYQNDDAAFIREAERIVNEHAARQPDANAEAVGRGQENRPAPETAEARPGADTKAADLDPIASAAARFAAENPDLPIFVGKNADGSDITTTPAKWLEDADAAMRQANDDVKLFEIAAGCLLGGWPMSYRDCIARIAQAAGRKLSDDEIRSIYERVHQAALDIKAGRGDVKTGDMFPDIVSQAAQKAAADLMAEAAQQKRQAEMQVVKMSARMGEVQRIKELGIEKHQLDALDRTHFRNYDGKVDVQSYESRFTGIRDMYSSKLLDTWHALGNDFLGFWQDKSKLKDLLREILGEDTGNALARQGAKKWSETVEAMRKHFNSEGGAIGKLDEGYLPQGWWDQERVARMGEQKFVDALLPALKKEAASGRHYNDGGIPWDEARLREFLSKSYDTISTGGHINTEPGKFQGAGKTANRHAEHRQIHFPDADSTLAAWETFGGKTALEIMTGHVEVMARDIALLEHYGPNPQMTIRTLLADALKNDVVADRPNKQKLEARAARMEDYINYSIGKTEPIAHPRLSRFISTMIPLNVASKLGGAVWASAFGDKPMMEAVAHLNNLPELRRWSNELSLFNPANAEGRRALQRQGLMLETARNGLLRFGDDLGNAPFANKLASAVMRITGMNAINGLRKGSHGAMLMDAIGFELKRGVDFNGLHDTDRRILKSYGITAQDWAIWKKADLDDMGKGYTMLTPEAISRIPDAEIANIAAPVVQAMKDKAYAEITELTRRNVQENQWLQGRANRIKQAEARAADRLNKFMTTRDTRLQKAGEWFKTQQDMIKAKVELAESQADIDAYILQQKSRNQMTDAVVNLITKRNPERSAERVLRESDKRGDAFSRQRGNIGEKLGDRLGNAERRIVELDARLRQMERDADAEIKAKYAELSKGIDKQWKELDGWIEGMKDRTTRRDFVIERIANEIPNKEIDLAAKARRDAIVKLLGAVNTEADFAIVTPGMKERAQFHSIGNKAGIGGEIGRAVLQFKSFPWAMFRRQMDAFNNMGGPVPKAAMASYLVVSTTLAGAMIMQVRDMLSGKDPRDMTKPEFWGAAFLQGGALGIYGDFIYGAGHTRYGSGILEAASGPTVGPLLEMGLVQPIQAIAKAKEGKDTKIVAQTVQDAKSFVPGNNVWYTKAALDHLIWQQTMDALSPGYLSSIRSRTRKEFGQDWWWGPGETTPARAPNLGAAIGE